MKKLVIIFLVSISLSCKQERDSIFKGEITIVDSPNIETVVGKQIQFNGIYTGAMSTYDSLVLFYSSKHGDYEGVVFNIKTGDRISSIVKSGKGPNEFIQSSFTEQFGDDLDMWFIDWARQKYILVDMLNNNWKKEIDFSNFRNKRFAPFSRIFYLNDSLVLMNNQGEPSYGGEYNFSPPIYRIFNSETNEELFKYEIFEGFSIEGSLIPEQDYLYSQDRIKPDRTKLVMAMRNVNQINIIDIKSGKVNGYRLKNTSDFNILKTNPKSVYNKYYYHVCVDNDFIFAITLNKDFTATVNVFDWEGNFVRILQINDIVKTFSFDPVNKILYSKNDMEEVYVYDLRYLYKK